MLWLLLPLIAGIWLARFVGPVEAIVLLGSAVGAILAGALAPQRNRLAVFLWAGALLAAATLAGWAYASVRTPPYPAEWEALPAREVFVTLEVKRLFRASDRFGYASGIAEIVEADFPVDDLRGTTTAFYLKPEDPALVPGRGGRYTIRGVLRFLNPAADLRDFDRYLVDTGVYFSVRQGRLLSEEVSSPWHWRTADALRATLVQALLRDRPDSGEAEILAAMFLGQRSLLTREQRDDFNASGTLHLFAISGLHVATVALLLNLFLTAFRLPRWGRASVGLAVLLSYVFVTGASPSAWRAFAMVGFVWTAALFPRPSNTFAALVASALVVLLFAPNQLFTAGFQLSYAVVAMLILYGAPLADATRRWADRTLAPESETTTRPRLTRLRFDALREVFRLVAFSFAAWLASAPLVAHYFGILTPWSLFLNAFLIGLGGLAVAAAATASLAALTQFTWLATHFAHGGWVIVGLMAALVQGYLWIPGSSFAVGWRADGLPFVTTWAMLGYAFLAAQPGLAAKLGRLRWWGPAVIGLAGLASGLKFL